MCLCLRILNVWDIDTDYGESGQYAIANCPKGKELLALTDVNSSVNRYIL